MPSKDRITEIEFVPPEPPEGENLPSSGRLLLETKKWEGKDASPLNLAPSEFACAESVANIIADLFPDFPRNIIGTDQLAKVLDKSPHFKRTLVCAPSVIVVSPRTATMNGHAGIFLTADRIASNNSITGKFEDNYSWKNWVRVFKGDKGLRILLWEVV